MVLYRFCMYISVLYLCVVYIIQFITPFCFQLYSSLLLSVQPKKKHELKRFVSIHLSVTMCAGSSPFFLSFYLYLWFLAFLTMSGVSTTQDGVRGGLTSFFTISTYTKKKTTNVHRCQQLLTFCLDIKVLVRISPGFFSATPFGLKKK